MMAATMATNNSSSASAGAMHYSPESSMELTKRFAQMQLKTAACAPKRQPTIVCEDIADDDLIDEDEGDSNQATGTSKEESAKVDSLLLRSASSASLTVPVVCEVDEITEKRRPPLPDH